MNACLFGFFRQKAILAKNINSSTLLFLFLFSSFFSILQENKTWDAFMASKLFIGQG